MLSKGELILMCSNTKKQNCGGFSNPLVQFTAV